MEIQAIFEIVQTGGTVGLLLLILIGGLRRWWVPGWAYDEKVNECNQWKTVAMRSMQISEEIVHETTRRN